MKRPREVALVGEARLATDVGQRVFRIEHALASFADAQPMHILADSLSRDTAKHP